MGQYRKTNHQIQNELDDIHNRISIGQSDSFIIAEMKLERSQYYRYKAKLMRQLAEIWAAKRKEDYTSEVELCKERLTRQLNNAERMAESTRSSLWAQLASELAISILKLEYEGLASLNNARYEQLEEKAGYIELKPATTDVPTGQANGLQSTERTNDSADSDREAAF